MKVTSEIYLMQKSISKAEWQGLVLKLAHYNGLFFRGRIIVTNEQSQLRYFVQTRRKLPATLNGCESFLMKGSDEKFEATPATKIKTRTHIFKAGSGLADLINWAEVKNKGEFLQLEVEFFEMAPEKVVSLTSLYLLSRNTIYKYIVPAGADILAVDFEGNKRYFYKNPPKYLDLKKVLPSLKKTATTPALIVEPFPYLNENLYLNQTDFTFNKHTVAVGASGTGKSKFLSSLVKNIRDAGLSNDYKVVVIDPHAALENDIGGLGKVIDFATVEDSIDLFVNYGEDVVASTELMLDLFKTLIADQYNSRLERVLRHATHLLLTAESFNFQSLRKLLLDLEYRNELLNSYREKLPDSISEFFLADFNELRTKAYTEAISPIIALIDEMEMVPVFNAEAVAENLKSAVKENFLTLFSLNRIKLGDKVTKTIAGLVMQQLLNLVQRREINEHIIFIVDEVAVVENPILARFLSEARKYNLSLIVAQQYFNQISEGLQKAIFANVVNYFVFRVSKLDANILIDNLNMKIPLDDTRERKLKILTELQTRECLARVEMAGELMPVFKGKTADFSPVPRTFKSLPTSSKILQNLTPKKINFKKSPVDLTQLLVATSSSRKVIK